MSGENFNGVTELIDELNTMFKRARNEHSKKTLCAAIESIEYLAVCLDDAEIELENNGLR